MAMAAFAFAAALPVQAQQADHAGPTYQRKGFYAGGGHAKGGDWQRRPMRQYSSQVSAGSFQRPYPYHLDYYRAKWGGSYAPYFGNLYGSPNYYYYGTPYYGDYSPYYGYGGFTGGYGYGGYNYGGYGYGGYGGPGYGGVPYGPWAGQDAAPVAPPVEAAPAE